MLKNLFFAGILKVKDENSRIRIRIHLSEAWIRGSGSTPKYHGSPTLAYSKQKSGYTYPWCNRTACRLLVCPCHRQLSVPSLASGWSREGRC